MKKANWKIYLLILLIFLLGLAVRIQYASILPVTNDEGAYLYDGFNINRGLVPLRDFLTKSLPLIYTLSLLIKAFGHYLMVGRGLSILSSLIVGIFIYLLGKELFDKKTAFVAASLFWTFPSVAAYTSLLHTEVFQMMFVVIASYLYIKGENNTKPVFFFFSGLAMAVAFFTRQSTIAIALWIVTLMYLQTKSLVEVFRKITTFSAGGLLILVPAFIWTISEVGREKLFELLGGSGASLSLNQASKIHILSIPQYVMSRLFQALSEISTVYNEGLVLTVLLIIFVFLLFISTKTFLKEYFSGMLFLFTLAFSILVLLLQSRFFLNTTLWKIRFGLNLTTFMIFGELLLLFFVYYVYKIQIKPPKVNEKGILFLGGWVVVLLALYLAWIKFRSPYYIEFLPPIMLFASMGGIYFFRLLSNINEKFIKIFLKTGLLTILAFVFILSYRWNVRFPFTGLHTPKELTEVVEYLEENSSSKDEILTASVIFPFLARRNVPFNISHPAWYGYRYINEEDLLLYFPPFNEFEKYIRENEVKIIIRDPFTKSAYFNFHPSFSKFVEENYQVDKEIGRAQILRKI